MSRQEAEETTTIPHSVEAEQQLLGALLTNNSMMDLVSGIVSEDDFYDPVHARIFANIKDRTDSDRIASPVTLKVAMQNDEGLTELGGPRYLARLAGASISAFAAPDYAKMIAELAARRSLLSHLTGIRERLIACEEDFVPIALDVEGFAGGLLSETSVKPLVRKHAKSLTNAIIEINQAYLGEVEVGVPSGIRQLDEKIQNMRPSNLIIVAGRPGMGKTSLAQSIAYDVAAAGGGVYFASLEMSGEDLGKRFLSRGLSAAGTKISYSRMIGGRTLREDEMRAVVKEGERQLSLPIWIAERDVRELQRLRASIRRAKQEMERRNIPLKLVVIDYIQRIKVNGERSMFDEITRSVDMLKTTAMEMNVPVMALAQLNREVERREPPIPILSDLKQSGSLEEDADVVIFPYREVYYLERDLEKLNRRDNDYFELKADVEASQKDLDLIIAKQRSGAVGTVKVYADMPFCHIYADKHEQEGNLI